MTETDITIASAGAEMPKAKSKLRQNVRELKRQMLLEAAYRLFSEHGYNDTSVEMITGELGSTKAVFYYQYPDKQSILEAIFDHALNATHDVIKAAVEQGGTADVVLKTIARNYAAWVMDNQVLVGVIWREIRCLDPNSRKRMAQKQREIRDLVVKVIDDGTAQSLFEVEDTETASRAVMGMISFIYTWWRNDKRLDREATAEQFATAALRIVGCRDS